MEDRLKAPLAATHPRLGEDRDETPAHDAQRFGDPSPLMPVRLTETCTVFSMVTMPCETPGSLRLRDVRIDLMRPNETVVSWLTTEDGATRFRVGQTVRLILETVP